MSAKDDYYNNYEDYGWLPNPVINHIEELEKDNEEMFSILMGTWNSLCNDDKDFSLLQNYIDKNSKSIEDIIDDNNI